MFFKNLTVFRLTEKYAFPHAMNIELFLDEQRHRPIGLSQQISTGWTPVKDNLFAHIAHGQINLMFKTETRKVPGSALKAAVRAECDEREHQYGRKVGKKERKEIVEDTLLALLPKVLPTAQETAVWIDTLNNWVVINTSSSGVSDRVVTELVRTFNGLSLQMVQLQQNAGAVLTDWLATQSGPIEFSIDRACELKACDDSKAVVKYTNSTLDVEDVRQHIQQGKRCTQLALTWEDRLSFVLTENFVFKKLKFLGVIEEELAQNSADKSDDFDADFAIMTGELHKMLTALIAAFGGEVANETNNDLF